MLHGFSLEFFGLLELKTHQEQNNRGDNTQSQCHTPHRAHVVLGENEHQDIWDKGANDKTPIDRDVSEHYEPCIPRPRLHLARCLGGCDTARGVLAANADSDKETVCGERGDHAVEGSAAV